MSHSRDNRLRCEPVEMPDGTMALARVRGELTEGDRRAMQEFYDFLRCHSCFDRHKCALEGCAQVKLREGDNATQEGSVQEDNQ
jgi:hypothetical protein